MRGVRLLLTGILVVGITLVLGSCGGGGESEQAGGAASEEAAGEVSKGTDISMYTGTITGTVHFQGTAPKPRKLNLDAECSVLHEGPVFSENVVVNENNTLKWVFVYIKEGLEGKKFDPPGEPVVFDQHGCMYQPHVFGVQVGQPIKILNSDPLLHNIHALPKVNRPFNFGMPKKGDERTRKFTKPEVMVRIKCDVHPWMSAYCGVVPHPYYSVTGDDGTFTLNHVPPGTYVLEAWHEKYGTATATVTVGENETQTVDFTFGPSS